MVSLILLETFTYLLVMIVFAGLAAVILIVPESRVTIG